MTGLEHVLIGGLVATQSTPHLLPAIIIFSLLPDVPSLILALFKLGPLRTWAYIWSSDTKDVPEGIVRIYQLSHSFVTAFSLGVFLYIFDENLVILAIAYGLHILCDIPVHSGRFATRFFYPVSSVHINAWDQSKHRWIIGINVLVIGILYLVVT